MVTATDSGNRVVRHQIKRQAMAWKEWPSKLWKQGVNYYFDSTKYSDQFLYDDVSDAFRKGAKLWESNTCINFTENPTAKDRIKVYPGQGCHSSVGRDGGEQLMSMGYGCTYTYITAHEIGHALGFVHTLARHDRDDFIKINKEAISNNMEGDFYKLGPDANENFGLPYDYGDIMHYPAD
ncbi:astacin [Ostertagia ostertagi]